MNCFYVCSERIANIREAFNVRERIDFFDFKISERVYGILPAEKGFIKGVTVDIKILV